MSGLYNFPAGLRIYFASIFKSQTTMEKKKETPAPAGYSNVCPYLMVESVESEVQFLQTVFGARIKEELKQEHGFVQHGEVSLGETVIMMGRARPEWPASPGANYVFVTQ